MGEPVPTWRLDDAMGVLTCGPLHASMNLNGLGGGILRPTWSGKDCSRFCVQQLRPPLVESQPARELVDSYVRGSDLVATFQRREPDTVAPEICWRATFNSKHAAVALEVILSMRTDLLDSQPHSAVDSVAFESTLFHTTTFDADAFKPLTAATRENHFENKDGDVNLFLFRNEKLGLSYAEAVHPSDLEAAEVDYRGESHGAYLVRSYLFPERLEKGVIRRGRICGWFMPAENDLETAVKLAREFVDEPLPLTT